MQQLKVKGIVIRRTKYNGTSAVVNIITQELGVIQALAFGINSAKKGKAASLQLFVYSEFCLNSKTSGYEITSAHRIEGFESLSKDYDLYVAGSRLLTAAYSLFYGNNVENTQKTFDLLFTALCYTAYSNLHLDDIYCWFLLNGFNAIGLCPCITECGKCNKPLLREKRLLFAPKEGGAICLDCAEHINQVRPVTPIMLEAMRRMLLLEGAAVKKLVLPLNLRAEMVNLLEWYRASIE